MPMRATEEPEWQTRKKDIDTRLDASGWKVVRFDPDPPRAPAAVKASAFARRATADRSAGLGRLT